MTSFVAFARMLIRMLITLATQLLAQQLCGSLYSNNSILSSSVAAAIASATSVAAAAVNGKDVTNVASYPPCAVSDPHDNDPGMCTESLSTG